ncbi:MAG: phosphatase PAP2 family protein [Clostridia bacterium]|nr:phosphatase PAP2 family protein [Clostridia bacterium]
MTLNKNNGTGRRITVMLLVMVLIMSFMSFSAFAENDAKTATDVAAGCMTEVEIDTENEDHATVLVNGVAAEEIILACGEEFTLEVTADDGYFIRKILVEKENADGKDEEIIISLTDDKSFSGTLVAENDMTVEIKITSDSFRFFDSFLGLDLAVFEWVQGIRNPVLTVLMKVITTLGDEGILFIAIGLILLLTKKYRKIGLTILVALVVMLICNNFVLKEIFARERPFNLFATFPEKYADWGGEAARYIYPNFVKAPHSYSFPSGHTSSAFAAGVAVLICNRKFGIPATIFAFIMGFTRIYVGVHYTTDVIAAAIVGIFYAILGFIIAKYLFPIADKLIDKVLGKLFKKKKEETK